MITCSRYHDFSAGHRVHGHEGKCRFLHGHNYRVHFTCVAEELDDLGRIIDFSVIKELLCEWLEQKWDHRFLVWDKDPFSSYLLDIDKSVVLVPFNPTAENMAKHLLSVCSSLLKDRPVRIQSIKIEETRKCSAMVEVDK